MTSFRATDSNISSHLRGYIILQWGRRRLGWCRTCPTLIEIGRVEWVCCWEEWVTIPHGFDNIWGIIKDSGLAPSVFPFFFIYLFKCLMSSIFSASIHLCITDEQKAFICRMPKIPFDEWKCRDLITLDELHAYCGCPVPTPVARRLNICSHRCKSLPLGKGVNCGAQIEEEGGGPNVGSQDRREGDVQAEKWREGPSPI